LPQDGGDSDSEEEVEQLAELEELLQRYAPNITCPLEKPKMPLFLCTPEKYQFALGTELMRAPELLFQPSMIGHEQGGLSETIEHVLKSFNVEEQSRLVNDIYIMGNRILWVFIDLLTLAFDSGGPSLFPGIVPRLQRDVMAMRPFGSSFKIRLSDSPSLSAWHGAKELALGKNWIGTNCITKAYFEECGGDYLSSHISSNPYWPKYSSSDSKEKMDVDF
jgi:actin-related protein 5